MFEEKAYKKIARLLGAKEDVILDLEEARNGNAWGCSHGWKPRHCRECSARIAWECRSGWKSVFSWRTRLSRLFRRAFRWFWKDHHFSSMLPPFFSKRTLFLNYGNKLYFNGKLYDKQGENLRNIQIDNNFPGPDVSTPKRIELTTQARSAPYTRSLKFFVAGSFYARQILCSPRWFWLPCQNCAWPPGSAIRGLATVVRVRSGPAFALPMFIAHKISRTTLLHIILSLF